jgi:large subunit ribosomal protein L18
MKLVSKAQFRTRRHLRLRQKVHGTAERPRMSVFVSNKHMYVQFIDDLDAKTLAAASTHAGEAKSEKSNVDSAKKLGKMAAETAKSKGISQVVFDRGGFAYRGRIKALAEAAREAGLKF